MRSKQQPRPSYRWLNKVGGEEVLENPTESKDETVRSESNSPNTEGEIHLQNKNQTLIEDNADPDNSDEDNLDQETSDHYKTNSNNSQHHQIDIERNIPASLIQDTSSNEKKTFSPNRVRDTVAASAVASNPELDVVAHTAGYHSALAAAAAAAGTVLPTQSAAMAAYLGVAAVAAQQSPFLLARRSLLLNRSHSPTFLSQHQSSLEADVPILDFSTKQTLQKNENKCDTLDLSKSDDPLDLTISRKRNNSSPVFPAANNPKVSKTNDYKTPSLSTWLSPISPYFGASVAAMSNISPKDYHQQQQQLAWNGVKSKMNVTTDALERMSELSRLNGSESNRQSNGSTSNTASTGRHSAWQSHWLNKGADAVKDVFKCVWCKQSFPTLESLTIHMKETQHLTSGSVNDNHRQLNISKSHGSQQQSSSHSMSSTTSTVSSETSKTDIGVLIKETMPLPRKLVRGQDVWLGKGAEQTRQILKCMWCGQSFRSLSEMTTHMQQTQHYTNIISQEQIISWKSSDEVKSNAGNSGNNTNANTGISSGSISTVSAVLTCKVCDEAFSSLKDLSNHMVKNAHYKEHIMRSISESGGRRKQTREKRKKSLPVRKLLEIERAQNEMKGGENVREFNSVRITCEKCGEKVETHIFVEHIKKCIKLNSEKKPLDIIPLTMNKQESGLAVIERSQDEISAETKKKTQSNSFSEPLSSNDPNLKNDNKKSPSVLSAIEQLIEKSFDVKSRHRENSANYSQTVSSSSILQRLGIDESADYTKPLIDPQTFRLLRNLSEQESSSRRTLRERSISESSSVSDCGSLNSQMEVTSPGRRAISRDTSYSQRGSERSIDENVFAQKNKDELERSTPDSKAIPSDFSAKDSCTHSDPKTKDDVEKQQKRESDAFKRSTQSVERISPSPKSDRSSVSEPVKIKKENSSSDIGSLGALSSMFDNLSDKPFLSNVSDLTDSSKPMRKTSSHPLAALQKLCDKTESHPPKNRQQIIAASASIALLDSQNQSSSTPNFSGSNNSVNTLSNDAKTCDDSLNKCTLCDTYFSSKASYRQHLSKIHFCKNDEASDLSRYSTSPQNHSPKSSSSFSSSHGNEFIKMEKTPSSEIRTSPPVTSILSEVNCDESPHSKFLKYTELAKQLSSKYV